MNFVCATSERVIGKGEQASRDYNEILNLPSTSAQTKQTPKPTTTTCTRKSQRVKNKGTQPLQKFDKNVLFRAAVSDDIKSISSMNFVGSDVNSCDSFGWSASMIAACEGSQKVFEFLLNKGCDLAIADRSGNTALSLAKSKNRSEIEKMINDRMANVQKTDELLMDVSVVPFEPFWCDECQQTFKETTKESHESSTLHRFNRKNTFEFSRRYFIPDSNVGFQMMLRQGWDRESGLGPSSEGKLYPVKTTIRKPRSGLGVKQDSARVTHYSAFDRDAVKWRPPAPRAKTKKQLERDLKRNQRKEFAIRRALS